MDQPPPIPGSPSAAVRATSLGARLINVFAIPGDVFTEVKAGRINVGNWLVPALIACLVGILTAFILYSQPIIQQQFRDKVKENIEAGIKSGSLTKESAEQSRSMMEIFTRPPVMIALASVGAVAGSFLRLFWWGLGLWLVSRWFLKIRFSFLKAVEVAGLASMIAVLGTVVSLLLAVNLRKTFSTPGLDLTLNDFSPDGNNYLMLGAMNVFALWFIGVMATGLNRLTGIPFPRAVFLLLPFWILTTVIMMIFGLGAAVL